MNLQQYPGIDSNKSNPFVGPYRQDVSGIHTIFCYFHVLELANVLI